MPLVSVDYDPFGGDAGQAPQPQEGRSPTRIEVRPIDPRARDLVVKTVYGEAGQEPPEGQAAVAAVIRNRLESGKYGPAVPNVVLAPNQFEPWNTQAGRNRMSSLKPDSPNYQAIGDIVDRVFSGDMADPTQGATHFYNPQLNAELAKRDGRKAVPSWGAGDPLAVIGRHSFYAPEGRVGVTDVSAQARHPPNAASPTTVTMAPGSAPTPKQPSLVPVDYDPFSVATGMTPETAPQQEPPAPGKPDIGRLNAALAGGKAGVTLNWGDELAGLRGAGAGVLPQFVQEANPVSSAVLAPVIGGARLLYEKATGQPGGGTAAYEQARDASRQELATAREQYPGTTLAGELAGSVATPIPGAAAARGAGWGVRALRSAGVGAGIGAVAGAGEGEGLGGTAYGAATGGAAGGVIGGAASPVLDLAARGAGAATREAGRYLFPSVETRAARMVSNAQQAGERIDPNAARRLTGQEAAAEPAARVVDTAGEPGRAVARWAANASPEARDTLNAMVDPRFEAQAARIVGWLDNTFHFPNAHAQQQAIDQAERGINREAYGNFYRSTERGLWSPEFERLTGSPAVVDAMRAAATKGKDRAIADRYGGFNPGVTFENGIMEFRRGPNGVPTYPNGQFWDYTYRELRDAGRAAFRAGRNDEGNALTGLSRQLREEIDNMATGPNGVSLYQTARQGAAHFFGAENALEAGQNFVRQNFNNSEVRAQLSRMSPQERQLFQDGFVSRYIETLNSTGDRRNVLNQIASSPAAREKLNLALGPQRANELEAILRVEGVMNMTRTQVQGNSTTARQLIEFGAAGTGLGLAGYYQNPEGAAQSLLVGAFAARGRNVDRRVANRVAEMLTSRDPAVFQRGLNLVARNDRLMDGIRSLDQRLARVGGQEASGVPALQSMGTGRAENDQPQVPGP